MKPANSPLQAESEQLQREFHQRFKSHPTFISRAPGRVNLIGEHTDYNLLPVLPMSINRGIRIYGCPRTDSLVRIANTATEFPAAQFAVDRPIQPCPGKWINYALAALHHVQQECFTNSATPMKGMDLLVDSDLPPAAGLSSSSALVIGTCLAALHVNEISWSPRQLSEHMTRAEKFVGTAGGGMDQTAIALGQPGSALLIEFSPLRTEPITLPAELSVFIINSGQRAEKTGAARFNYNRRSLECAVAIHLLASNTDAPVDTTHCKTLRDVYDACDAASVPWSTLLTACLPPDPIHVSDAISTLGANTFAQLCSARHLDAAATSEWLPGDQLQVYARAAHVLSESDRVYQFAEALKRTDIPNAAHLANASHASCRDLYHISTPRLENLVALGKSCGARAVRITGAGFGGCLVALVEKANAASFKTKMEKRGVDPGALIHAIPGGAAHVAQLTS